MTERLYSSKVLIFNGEKPAIKQAREPGDVQAWGSGGSLITEMHARGLQALGYQISTLTPTHDLDFNIPWGLNAQNLHEHPELATLVLQHVNSADIIYVSHPLAGSVVCALKESGKISSEKSIVYVGQTWGRLIAETVPGKELHALRDEAELLVLRNSDRIIVYTAAEKDILVRLYGLDSKELESKIRIVPLGVDLEKFTPSNREVRRPELRKAYLGTDNNTLNFFMLSRIVPSKRQDLATEAFVKVLEENPGLDLSLSFHGEPDGGVYGKSNRAYYEALVSFINTLPLKSRQKIRLHGASSPLEACSAGDVFLGPSLYESWFLSLSEAMACGVPTIVSNIAVLREVAGDRNCFVNPYDVNSLKDAMLVMAKSPSYRTKISQYNYLKSRNYSWKKSTDSLGKVFQELI